MAMLTASSLFKTIFTESPITAVSADKPLAVTHWVPNQVKEKGTLSIVFGTVVAL